MKPANLMRVFVLGNFYDGPDEMAGIIPIIMACFNFK